MIRHFLKYVFWTSQKRFIKSKYLDILHQYTFQFLQTHLSKFLCIVLPPSYPLYLSLCRTHKWLSTLQEPSHYIHNEQLKRIFSMNITVIRFRKQYNYYDYFKYMFSSEFGHTWWHSEVFSMVISNGFHYFIMTKEA